MQQHRQKLAMLCISLAACGTEAAPSHSGETPVYDKGVIDWMPKVDDSQLTVKTQADVEAKRQQLANYIWEGQGFPKDAMPARVDFNVKNPLVNGAPGAARVDRLIFNLGGGLYNEAFHFVPKAPNGRLVIVHHGHAYTFDYDLVADTIAALVAQGFGVLGGLMPCFNYDFPCPAGTDWSPHDYFFRNAVDPESTARVLRVFLEHLPESVNYLTTRGSHDGFPTYSEIDMVGLSGGGWSTVMYAALDPRIRISIPVSGSKPLYMRPCPDNAPGCFNYLEGDAEQLVSPPYQIAGYLDLYAMGASGPGRRQVQVQIRHDGCCFGEEDYLTHGPLPGLSWTAAVRAYERTIQGIFPGDGGQGWFRFEIDETSAGTHVISPGTRAQVILAELGDDDYPFAATRSGAIFARGADGALWQGPTDWSIIGQSVVGTPAVVSDTQVLVRDASSNLVSLSQVDGAWQPAIWPGVLAGDPAVASAASQVHAVGVGVDARLWHWTSSADGSVVAEQADANTEVVGRPAILASDPNGIDAFVRRSDDGLEHLAQRAGTWTSERVGTDQMRGFPTAVATADGYQRVYMHDADDHLIEWSRASDGATWQRAVIDNSDALVGSPSALADVTGHHAYVVGRTAKGAARYWLDVDSAAWSYQSLGTPAGATLVRSPVAVRGGLLGRSDEGQVWHGGATSGWSELGALPGR